MERRVLNFCLDYYNNPYVSEITYAFLYQIEYEQEFGYRKEVQDDLKSAGEGLYNAARDFMIRHQNIDLVKFRKFLKTHIRTDFILINNIYTIISKSTQSRALGS
jgi:hypothetical protein